MFGNYTSRVWLAGCEIAEGYESRNLRVVGARLWTEGGKIF